MSAALLCTFPGRSAQLTAPSPPAWAVALSSVLQSAPASLLSLQGWLLGLWVGSAFLVPRVYAAAFGQKVKFFAVQGQLLSKAVSDVLREMNCLCILVIPQDFVLSSVVLE